MTVPRIDRMLGLFATAAREFVFATLVGAAGRVLVAIWKA